MLNGKKSNNQPRVTIGLKITFHALFFEHFRKGQILFNECESLQVELMQL
jgi:hypothetical protein